MRNYSFLFQILKLDEWWLFDDNALEPEIWKTKRLAPREKMSDDWQMLGRREESICYEIRRHYNLRDRVTIRRKLKFWKLYRWWYKMYIICQASKDYRAQNIQVCLGFKRRSVFFTALLCFPLSARWFIEFEMHRELREMEHLNKHQGKFWPIQLAFTLKNAKIFFKQ